MDGGESFYEEGCHAELFDGPCNAGQTRITLSEDGSRDVMLFTAPPVRDRTHLTGYLSHDGGRTWKLQYKNTNEKAFFDAFAFWDKTHGIAMSDPVDGKYFLLETSLRENKYHPNR